MPDTHTGAVPDFVSPVQQVDDVEAELGLPDRTGFQGLHRGQIDRVIAGERPAVRHVTGRRGIIGPQPAADEHVRR